MPASCSLCRRSLPSYCRSCSACAARTVTRVYCKEGEAGCILPPQPGLVKRCGLRIIDRQGMNTKTSSQCSGDRVVVFDRQGLRIEGCEAAIGNDTGCGDAKPERC